MRYLNVNTYLNPLGDCSNKGVTFTCPDKLVVPCPDGYLSEDDVVKRGYIILEVGEAGGRMHFRPPNPNKDWLMFGGNFVYSSDSRFSTLYGGKPIHVHDRRE